MAFLTRIDPTRNFDRFYVVHVVAASGDRPRPMAAFG
jgi:hypothetical protein